MEKHTVTPCAVTSHACPGANSSLRWEWSGCMQLFSCWPTWSWSWYQQKAVARLTGRKLALFLPRCFKAHLKERTDSTGSSPVDRIRQARALERITMITIRLALQELFFTTRRHLAPRGYAGVLLLIRTCVGVSGVLVARAELMHRGCEGKREQEVTGEKAVRVWFCRVS